MLTYSSCATCGQQIALTEGMPLPPVHGDCPPPSDPLNVLRREFVAAVAADRTAEADRLAAQLDAFDDRPPQFEAAALTYASWGWHVFPCRPGAKTPATKHGFKEATRDPEKIKDWWWRWPRANVALATGRTFDVLDVDPDGAEWWRRMRIDYDGQPGPLPDIHGLVGTPRPGGFHVYVKATGDGNMSGFVEGVDYRGVGGYVLAPPSVLDPAAYAGSKGPTPPEPLRYSWVLYPSPELKPAGWVTS